MHTTILYKGIASLNICELTQCRQPRLGKLGKAAAQRRPAELAFAGTPNEAAESLLEVNVKWAISNHETLGTCGK